MTEHSPGDDDAILVAATEDVGSARLAVALAARDPEAIGRALRHDVVVVPLTEGSDGAPLTRVFAADRPGRYELLLFSSTQSFSAFLAGNENRRFALQRGRGLRDFLLAQHEVLDRVVFDAAGPHPMAASVDDVIDALTPRAADDDVDWVASGGAAVRASAGLEDLPEEADPTRSRVVGLDIALNGDWFVIALDDEQVREAQVAELAKRQLASVPDARVLRAEVVRWLQEACRRAAAGGGRFLAFLLQHTGSEALALNVTMYWHELGPAVGDRSHLDRMTEQLRAQVTGGAELVGAQTPAGPFIRFTRIIAGARELDAQEIPLLAVDYWLEFPDQRGLCLLTFSSPHTGLRSQLQAIADGIVLSGAWVLDTPVE